MRAVQPEGRRGSLKWIQRAVATRLRSLEAPILARTGASSVDWRSPLREDDFAEYRDATFLARIGLERLNDELADFWPSRGPQRDALGVSDGGVLLVEAKAHVGELCSPGTQASGALLDRIAARLAQTAVALGARDGHAPWTRFFYQLANRLAHLRWLRERNVPAWLVLVNFCGDVEMAGPATAAEWRAAYQVAWHVMGLPARHALSRWVIEVFPDVRELA